ncbi:hypothetical protein Ct61P_13018 [Colletotrichum tofieldiae]|nr:hypothetical protein Ct61P_13018 [Colletotrichum tofieldiae]
MALGLSPHRSVVVARAEGFWFGLLAAVAHRPQDPGVKSRGGRLPAALSLDLLDRAVLAAAVEARRAAVYRCGHARVTALALRIVSFCSRAAAARKIRTQVQTLTLDEDLLEEEGIARGGDVASVFGRVEK